MTHKLAINKKIHPLDPLEIPQGKQNTSWDNFIILSGLVVQLFRIFPSVTVTLCCQ